MNFGNLKNQTNPSDERAYLYRLSGDDGNI